MTPSEISPAERKRRIAQGQRLAALREERTGLSPEAFGLEIGVDGSTIRKIEAGLGTRRPHVRVMFAVAKGLDLPMAEVFPPERSRQPRKRVTA